ncbi:MAG TPA: diacylglycerol kinase family protein [Flavipsychrobacter sp.]|nr:diacylglycerol kinase family protein [Flavipsychrobacter sp.]
MKHLVFLINPNSGVDRVKDFADTIQTSLDQRQFTYEIQYTEREKHGIELARNASQNGAYGVVAIGGDGSVNDVLKGLVNTDTVMGIIPRGSGNGMARSLGIPLAVKEAVAIINRNKVQATDVAYANENIFLSNAGVGFDATIIQKFRQSKRRGFISYCSIIHDCIWGYKDETYSLTVDGKTYTETAFIINVANGKQLGYDFVIAPHADWTDGLLDVTVIRKFPKLMAVLLALRLRTNSIHKSQYVRTFRGKHISVSAARIDLLQTDGDSHRTQSPVVFHVSGKQNIFVP